MTKSIFFDKPKTTAFHCRISNELHGRVRAIQAHLKQHSDGAIFPLDQIVEEALTRATRQAETELHKPVAAAPLAPALTAR